MDTLLSRERETGTAYVRPTVMSGVGTGEGTGEGEADRGREEDGE